MFNELLFSSSSFLLLFLYNCFSFSCNRKKHRYCQIVFGKWENRSKLPYERKANSQKIKINKTPIHFAIDGGSLETIKLLVENKGVDINEKYILYFDIFITFDIFIIFI